MNAKRVIGYVRVSTVRQSRSELGLNVQREAVEAFCTANGYELATIMQEVGSGAAADSTDDMSGRPVLRAALKQAKKDGAAIVVARLDRLSRSVEFVANAINRGVEFKVADLGPDVPSLILHVVAAVGQEERRLISQRTKEGLRKLRERIAIGTADPDQRFASNPRLHEVKEAAAAGRVAKADAAAVKIWPAVRLYQSQGLSVRAIARQLNDDGHQTSRGADWSGNAVARVIKRMEDRETGSADMAA